MDVRRRKLFVFLVFFATGLVRAFAQSPGANRVAHPDFDGIWNSATATPLERPSRLKDKAFFTPEEAADWERQVAESNQEPSPRGGGEVHRHRHLQHVLPRVRLQHRQDPPHVHHHRPSRWPHSRAHPGGGRGQAPASRRDERNAASAEDTGLQDQCLAFVTAGPPMLPYSYNSNYQIVQTRDVFVVHAEMIHDTRIIHLDGRPHLPPAVRLWMGDSIGRWDGATLVVDTTNFNDGGGFYGDAGGNFGWDRNLHVVERFSLLDADTLLYRFEIDDPTAFTKPWKGELTMARSSGPSTNTPATKATTRCRTCSADTAPANAGPPTLPHANHGVSGKSGWRPGFRL